MLPGDTNGGKWDGPEFAAKLGDPSLTPKQAVLKASHSCYGTVKKLFAEGGYDKLLVAIGDHELGGNGWNPRSTKNQSLEYYRAGFQKEFNRDADGIFMYSESIGNAKSRPMKTPYLETSYAHQHKNVLFVTVDVFHDTSEVFINRAVGLGGEGSVTCTVEGEHLKWFTSVLQQAREDVTIKHIIVQGHVPILEPVRQIDSSGQFFDNGSESDFWKVMVEYGVDVYLAGEVHATTTTKDANSNLLQVVSRGNQFTNFLSIEVSDDSIVIKAFNEIDPEPLDNHTYVVYGEIAVNKTGDDTAIVSNGILELVNVDGPLIRFDFEEKVSMETRPVIGMKSGDSLELVKSEINVRGVSCSEAMENKGGLGRK